MTEDLLAEVEVQKAIRETAMARETLALLREMMRSVIQLATRELYYLGQKVPPSF